MKCFKCDKEIPEGSKFCNHCGCETVMICPACGKKIPDGSKFCNHCGCPISANDGYIDLGLPSGTKWKAENEIGYYEFDEAVSKYGYRLPTREQLKELKNQCQWEWMGVEYRVTGPNGNAIVLPAAGRRLCGGSVYRVGSYGDYWSSTPGGSGGAWRLYFRSSSVYMYSRNRCRGRSVRLVQD